jgi:amidohydrolase
MEGTLRTFDPAVRSEIKERMARIVRSVAEAHGTTATLAFRRDGNPPTINDATLARNAAPALARVFGRDKVIEAGPLMVAEDFPAYAAKAPTLFLLMGGRNEAKGIASVNHTEDFDFDEDVLPLGVRAMTTLVWDFLATKR